MKMLARHRREELICQQNLASSSSSEEDTDQLQPPPVRRKPVGRKKASPQKRGMTLALTSGVFAALAGTFGKLAINQAETISVCEQVSNYQFKFSTHDAFVLCENASVYIRIVAFVTMILLNTVMWTTFVKALHYCSTSLEATITNTAANFFSSAIVGQLVFDESVSLMWGFGTVLIICGLLLMNYGGGGKTGAELRDYRKKSKIR